MCAQPKCMAGTHQALYSGSQPPLQDQVSVRQDRVMAVMELSVHRSA